MLISLIGFTLLTAFAQLHSKRVRLGALSTKALTKELEPEINTCLENLLPLVYASKMDSLH